MKKVLIITYYWPPGSGSGVQRFLKFSKYLKQFGWEPIILTVKNGNFSSFDKSLEKDIAKDTLVYKSSSLEPYYWYNLLFGKKNKHSISGSIGLASESIFSKLALYIRANFFVPDARVGWNYFAFKKAEEILNSHKIDAVISTGPPQSSHLIAEKLKLKFNLPWIVDFRDPWTSVFYNNLFPRSKRTIEKDKSIEDRIVKNADAISVVSNGLVEEFKARNENIHLIYNGYDDSDFENLNVKKSEDEFVITYVGNFMSSQNVPTFWNCISDLVKTNDRFKDRLKIKLVGNIDDKVRSSISSNNLDKFTDIVGYVSHKKSVEYMKESDLLLFVIPNSVQNEKIITGKLFEYLATGNDIISFGPIQGDASNILDDMQKNKMLNYNDIKSTKQTLLHCFEKDKKDKPYSDGFKIYSRKALTNQLSILLDSLSD
jgi:hypothetical protein